MIGLKLFTNGVLIVGMTELEDINNIKLRPYEEEDIKEGDTIIEVNNVEISSIEDLQKAVNSSLGEELELTLLRDGEFLTSRLTPAEVEKNKFKLGLWVKDAATGVGTMTFYEPKTKTFAALGHGIVDSDTDKLIDIDSGEIVTSKIISIQKSEVGEAGEIRGSIAGQGTIGEVIRNTEFGIFGRLNNLSKLNIDSSKTLPVASRNEIEVGEAKLRCTLDDGITKDYNIEIEKIFINNNQNNKSMQIKIIDQELTEKTGGIIRGLSGAPIIQNGKFIGAVTNVLVNDPERGYAVFADIMIKELLKIEE
ncbi:MAG: SpoIVB peptidase [Clostridia bacterium]|nr:SpoIVB peptidase [Clostridia bacterium]